MWGGGGGSGLSAFGVVGDCEVLGLTLNLKPETAEFQPEATNSSN